MRLKNEQKKKIECNKYILQFGYLMCNKLYYILTIANMTL